MEVSAEMDPRDREGSEHANVTDDAEAARVECGADYDELVAQVAERRAPVPERAAHQRGCPHCRAAIAELQELWSPVAALARSDVRAPAGLIETVMARVRELPRHSSYALVGAGGRGSTRVAARVIGAIARRAALQVPGVSAAVGGRRAQRDETMSDRGASVGVSGSHVVVEVSLVVRPGAVIPTVVAQVRRAVIERIAALTDLTVTAVDVAVLDLDLGA